jgi:hypothetical protein
VGDKNGSMDDSRITPPVGPEAPGAGCKSVPGPKVAAEAIVDTKNEPNAARTANRGGRISVLHSPNNS